MVSKEEFVCGGSRVLHNFKLPALKWGSRKVLRCMKVDDVAVAKGLRSFGGRGVSSRFSAEEKLGFGRRAEARIEGLVFDFPATAADQRRPAGSESEMMNPWNLRTRRTAISKLNPNPKARGREMDSPVNVKFPWCLRGVGEKRERERAKFSVSLSKEEIEEDFLAITGNRVPRRPKKRSKNVQKQLDMLFPGLWLTEVSADLYKVPDVMDSGKVIY